MLAGQNIEVDQLVKILRALKVERMTGSLVVTRGKGISYELGTLVFLNGRVIQGRVGRLEGREAFNWLLTWGKCWYTFVFSIMSDAGQRSKRQFSDGETLLQSRIPHVRLVPMGQAQRQHAGRDGRARESWPGGKLGQLTQERGKALLEDARRVDEAVPYLSRPLQVGLQVLTEKGLSRMHRRVLLLVNGSRRVEDLMRLLMLSEHEMLALLYDLQDMGIVSLPSLLLL